MHLPKHLLAYLFLCLFFTSTSLSAQIIEWEYEVQDELSTNTGNFWIDEDGNGFFNIRRSFIHGNTASSRSSFLLQLNAYGQYAGSVVINQCDNRAPLYPFGRRRFITSGYNCREAAATQQRITPDTRVFNRRGKLLKIGEAFPGYTSITGAVCHDDDITFFNKPNNAWGYTFLSIGKVNEEVEIKYDSIPLAPLAREEYGIILSNRKPVLTDNNTWVLTCDYGDVEGGQYKDRLAIRHGIIMGIKDKEIQWTYPEELDRRVVSGLCTHNGKIGIIRSPAWGKNQAKFLLLDENGTLLKSMPINARSVRGMGMNDDHFVVMDRTKLTWYNFEGEVLGELVLAERGLETPLHMQMLNDGSLIFSTRRGHNAVITKVRLDQLESEIEEAAPEARAVSYSTVEEVSNETISISVYPNPASIDIIFEVDQDVDISSGFLLQIFNASGQMMHEATFNEQRHEVYVNELPAGTYFYRIAYQKDEEQRLIQGKFVKA